MSVRNFSFAAVSSAATLALLTISPAGAGAATTVGATTPAPLSCGGAPITMVQTISPGNVYAAPAAGVITSWSMQGGGVAVPEVKLKVGRTVGGTTTVVAESSGQMLPAGTLSTFTTRVPVQAGDVIGKSTSNGQACAVMTDPSFTVKFAAGDVPVGGALPSLQAGAQANISAQLEPDADGDGFGDETQDECPADPAKQTLCQGDVIAPETKITKSPKNKGSMAVAKYKFTSTEAGSTFECKVDKKPYKACNSPLTFATTKGKHKFSVRATDAAGNTDSSPAKDKFKVLKKK